MEAVVVVLVLVQGAAVPVKCPTAGPCVVCMVWTTLLASLWMRFSDGEGEDGQSLAFPDVTWDVLVEVETAMAGGGWRAEALLYGGRRSTCTEHHQSL